MGTDCNAWNGTVDKNKDGIDGVDVILDLRLNAVFVELVLLEPTGVG